VKVVVTNRPHSRRHNGIELVSGVSAVLAWFPASWASKIAPCFIGEEGGSIQVPQEVAIVCPHREVEGMQRDAVDQVLQAVKFTDKNAPGLNLELDEEFKQPTASRNSSVVTRWEWLSLTPCWGSSLLEPRG
jgi:hypothetical protein